MFSTQEEKVSYIIGLDIGHNLRQQGITLESNAFAAGVADAIAQAKPRLSQAEAEEAMKLFEQEMSGKHEHGEGCGCGNHGNSDGAANLKRGQDFLIENKTKDDVMVLPSGLQYKELKAGTGRSPGARDMVTTHYHGTLIDGTVFDSSYDRNEPATFPVNGVIAGWTEALQLMKEGSVWELYIPPRLAYGEHGAGGAIGPNETLIFKVELLKVQ